MQKANVSQCKIQMNKGLVGEGYHVFVFKGRSAKTDSMVVPC